MIDPFPGDPAAIPGLPESLRRRLRTPCLVIDMRVVRHNLQVMSRLLDGDLDRWRPHVKTTKIPAVYAEMVGAGVRAFKCATVREGRVLVDALDREGVTDGDILVAHFPSDPDLRQLDALAQARPQMRFSALVEHVEGVRRVPPSLSVFVDVNVGLDRTGIPAGDLDRIVEVAQACGDRFRGVHGYEGMTTPEANEEGVLEIPSITATVSAVDALVGAGVEVAELITSGTPTFVDALGAAALHELAVGRHRVSPGTIVFHDTRSQGELPGQGFRFAATVLARVVSHPAPGIVTCDAGSKSLAAEVGDPCAIVLGEPQLEARGPSEEHLPIHVARSAPPPRGQFLRLVPVHVCPTVNLAETALVLHDDEQWEVVDVAGRAHDPPLDTD